MERVGGTVTRRVWFCGAARAAFPRVTSPSTVQVRFYVFSSFEHSFAVLLLLTNGLITFVGFRIDYTFAELNLLYAQTCWPPHRFGRGGCVLFPYNSPILLSDS